MIVIAAEHPSHHASLPFLFLWSTLAMAYGIPFATNLKGCADRLAEGQRSRFGTNLRAIIRVHSSIFAVLGVVTFLAALGKLILG
ncbi:hypothetical protein ABZ806_09665 [Spirillospora sp. NPDC047418]